MVAAGYRELALTGVHTGSYGYAYDDRDALVDLLAKLDAVDGLDRSLTRVGWNIRFP